MIITFTKRFTSGLLEGIEVQQTIRNVSDPSRWFVGKSGTDIDTGDRWVITSVEVR